MAYNTRGTAFHRNFDFNSHPPAVMGANLSNSEFQNVPSDQSTFITGFGTASPLMLGTQYTTYDGRVFKYMENADTVALTEGMLVVPYTDSALGSAVTTSSTDSTVVTATMVSVLANQYAGGYLCTVTGTGIGQTRRIVSNTATVSGSVTFQLERAFATAVGSTCGAYAYHPYRIRQSPTNTVACQPITGVSYSSIAAATAANGQYNSGISYYGWIQTAGFCERVLTSGAMVAATATVPVSLVPSTVAGKAILQVATLANNFPFGTLALPFNRSLSDPGSVSAFLTNCQG